MPSTASEEPRVELADADDDELGGVLEGDADLHANLTGLDDLRGVDAAVTTDEERLRC